MVMGAILHTCVFPLNLPAAWSVWQPVVAESPHCLSLLAQPSVLSDFAEQVPIKQELGLMIFLFLFTNY